MSNFYEPGSLGSFYSEDSGSILCQSQSADAGKSDKNAKNHDHDETARDRPAVFKRKMKLNALKRKASHENDFTVFLGNLPVDVTKKQITRLCSEFGKIEAIRLRSAIPKDKHVTKKAALIRNGAIFAGRHLKADVVDDKRKVYPTKYTVFVGNLPFDISDDSLWHHFDEACGNVNTVRIVRDKSTGLTKGFAFVVFQGCFLQQKMGNVDSSSWFKNPILTDSEQSSDDEDYANTMNTFNLKPEEVAKKGLPERRNEKKPEKGIAVIEDFEKQGDKNNDLEKENTNSIYRSSNGNGSTPVQPVESVVVARPFGWNETDDDNTYLPGARDGNHSPLPNSNDNMRDGSDNNNGDAKNGTIQAFHNVTPVATLEVPKTQKLANQFTPVEKFHEVKNAAIPDISDQKAKFSAWIWNNRLDDLSDCKMILFGDSYI